MVAIGRVGEDGKSVFSDDDQLVGRVSGDELPPGSVVDQDGDVMDGEVSTNSLREVQACSEWDHFPALFQHILSHDFTATCRVSRD